MCNPKKHFIRQIHIGHEHNWSLIQVDDDYVEPADAHRCPNRWEQSAAPSSCVAAKICARCTTAVWIMGRHRANGDGALTGGSSPWTHLHALQQQLVLVAATTCAGCRTPVWIMGRHRANGDGGECCRFKKNVRCAHSAAPRDLAVPPNGYCAPRRVDGFLRVPEGLGLPYLRCIATRRRCPLAVEVVCFRSSTLKEAYGGGRHS